MKRLTSIFKRLRVLLVGIALLMCFPMPVSASVASPSSLSLYSVEVYRDCLETGDQLYLVAGEIEYASNPAGYDVSDLIVVRLMNGTTELGSTTPYAYYDSGFDYFIVGLYFSAAEVTSLSMGWGAATGYSISAEGNPFIDWASTVPETAMTTFQLWYDGTTVTDTQSRVTTRLRVMAQTLEDNYNPGTLELTQFVANLTKLTTYGEDYFVNSIPSLRLIAPQLFVASISPVTLSEKILTNDYYSTGDTTGAQVHGANYRVQTYTAKGTYEVVGVYLKLYVVGSPGTITIAMKATTGGLPSGANLASGTISGTSITTSTSGDWYEIIFTDGYTQTLGSVYSFMVSAASGDSSNYVVWRVDISGAMANGSRCDSTDSGTSWVADTDDDFMFIAKGGIGTQTGAYSKQLAGRLYGTDIGNAIENLAVVIGIPFSATSAMIWVVIEFAVAALICVAARTYKFYLLAMAILAPIGGYTGFWDLNIAVAIGVVLGLGGLYVAFHR